ncbi:MAG: serine hydrolase domain-containing protein [Nannocystales bacterium]
MRTTTALTLLALTLPGCTDDNSGGGTPMGGSSGDMATTEPAGAETSSGSESSGGDDESSSGEPVAPDFAALEAELEMIRENAGAPGLAVGLVAGNTVLWTGAFGTRDLESMAPVDTDTAFRLGSISKTFVGVAMMRAQEMGIIDLDDTIEVPFTVDNPHIEGEAITYRSLAQHRSGILDTDWYECAYTSEDGSSYALPEEQEFCPATPLPGLEEYLTAYLDPTGEMYTEENYAAGPDGEPGTTYEYSNIGAGLASASLGYATQEAVGQDFIAFSNAEVFGPLGLEHTRWMRDELPDPDNAAVPHMFDDGFAPIARYNLSTFADGALYSSVDDLSRYLAAIVPGQGSVEDATVLQPDSVEEMLDFVDLGDGDGQGIYWEFFLGMAGHTGGDPGVSTAMGYDTEAGVGVVILLNSTGPNTELLMLQVFESLQSFAAEGL